MPTPAEKGDALQQAAHAIEEHILRTSPTLREKTFFIEDKKIVCVGGVHHEIDIFVTVGVAPGYRAIYIFECKNWKKAISKKEIVDFSEKIDAVNAAHGYFIAKSFTKDARAQAKKDARVTVLVATERDPTGIPIPGSLLLLLDYSPAAARSFRSASLPAPADECVANRWRALASSLVIDSWGV